MPSHVVIVGGSMGGLRAAEQLIANKFDGVITIVGDEQHMPYNRPPLSKDVLAAERDEQNSTLDHWHSSVAFRQRKSIADVQWKLGTPAVSSDLDSKTVTLADGEVLHYDGLVVATGLRPRRLDLPGPKSGRHVIRTLDDAIGLRGELEPGNRVVVVGGGFIGCETAATARTLGCEVHIVEPLAVPMIRPLGEEFGNALRRVHEAFGVHVHTGVSVERAVACGDDSGRLSAVILSDGTRLDADVLIESVGSHPNVEWLDGNGLDLGNGVLCDNHLRVESRPDVVAVGDIARFPDPATGNIPRRIEHWCIPTDTAKRAAVSLIHHLNGAGEDTTVFSPLPSFWSDQFGLRLQGYGSPGDADHVSVLEGDLSNPIDDDPSALDGTVVGYYRGSQLVGVVMISPAPASARKYRDAVETSRAAVLTS
ncbi:NAD(P)/FAD-dependent oxidoreductase [Rhodococcus sp. JS3073]|uniref:NAD(P)/FAD-dependent oxidoreductase n=1 Tax=Rhodococcus sp. JS3073 TaxID=3002901 RepID=UPI002285A4E4|nr:FAD-dependent oxidoreductase [Rhodococcus sp. JS3073]WAM11743.1 FAD-dependent oxidoreductase [Rhodococcus sp. JS3073]